MISVILGARASRALHAAAKRSASEKLSLTLDAPVPTRATQTQIYSPGFRSLAEGESVEFKKMEFNSRQQVCAFLACRVCAFVRLISSIV